MNKGEKIPDILGKDQDGREIKAIDFTGKKLVLYFYPKDSTPGCTAEACSLRDNYQELLDRGYAVVGVSCDSDTSHRRFIEKNSLPFPLITDPDHRLAEEMG
ncbi:MAG: peroxiredoxin, partial [Muribaculaceae bacterium]|nr:peroxiredoxin [Muribaculaceae bacterium]